MSINFTVIFQISGQNQIFQISGQNQISSSNNNRRRKFLTKSKNCRRQSRCKRPTKSKSRRSKIGETIQQKHKFAIAVITHLTLRTYFIAILIAHWFTDPAHPKAKLRIQNKYICTAYSRTGTAWCLYSLNSNFLFIDICS